VPLEELPMPRVGLISDTHGLLRPEAKSFLEGCDRIIHGGDIGNPDILEQLAELAPLTVVRGNNDHGDWAGELDETQLVQIGGILVYVIHDIALLDIDPRAAGVRVVVSGHSHVPAVTERDDVLFVNPGSAGPRRFKLPIAAGELTITANAVSARIVRFGGDNAGRAKA
jgi:putative phosphoesterase